MLWKKTGTGILTMLAWFVYACKSKQGICHDTLIYVTVNIFIKHAKCYELQA